VQVTSVTFGERDHGIRIFPNPVSSQLYIEAQEGLRLKKITLRTAVGKKVYSQRDWEPLTGIDMSGCVPGLYFLEMSLENGGHVAFRVVKV
jgi:hypothetical protein